MEIDPQQLILIELYHVKNVSYIFVKKKITKVEYQSETSNLRE